MPVFCILFAISAGCSRQALEPQCTIVTIAFPQWVGYGLFYLAQEKGFCKEEGVELDFVDEQLDSARRDAFKQGMLDCEAGTLDLLVSKVAQGAPIMAVMEIGQSSGSDAIVVTEDIRSLEDLAGKRIVLTRDDVGEVFLSFLLSKNMMPLDVVIIVPKRSEEVADAFLKGEADACVTWEPQVTEALKRPGAHILASTKDYPGIIIDTLNVRSDLVENNPGLVRGIMRSWFKALAYYREHPLEASEIIASHYKITSAQYREQVQGLKWADYETQSLPEQQQQWAQAFHIITEIKLANKRISQKPDATKSVTNRLLEELYEDSK